MMAASDHLSSQFSGPFYHGSPEPLEGSEIDPQRGAARKTASFTWEPEIAHSYSSGSRPGIPGYVHQVEATGPFEPDDWEDRSYKSAHPLKVTRTWLSDQFAREHGGPWPGEDWSWNK